jgi:protein-tyrosine sulfotransferase
MARTFRPLFVLCGPRRGSTLLRYILDTHSQIASPGEVELGSLCARLEDVIRWTQPGAVSLAEPTALSLAETRKIVRRIMGSYAARRGKRIWCDKSIDNLHHLDLLPRVFPDARFICLYRDSLDVVYSCLECSRQGFMDVLATYAARQPTNLIAAMMTAWIHHTGTALEFEQQFPERCFRIRYEDLVSAPEDSLRPLLAFIGVEWEDGLLDAVFSTRHDPGGGDQKIDFSRRIDASRVGSGQRLYLAELPKDKWRRVDELSAQLSYPPLGAGRKLRGAADTGADGAEAAEAAEVGGPGGDGARAKGAAGGAGKNRDDDGGADRADARAPGGARHFFEKLLRQRLSERAELADAIQGSCRIVLEGQGGGQWKLDFTGAAPAIESGGGAADCSVIIGVADFEDIIAGRANPMVSLWDGKVTVEGNQTLAGQVAQLIYLVSQDVAS